MDNKKLILILALLGGGYLIWRNSKVAAQSVGEAPADLPPVIPSDVPPSGSELPTTPKSQKDCPEGYVFVPTDCLVPPCEGGNCLPAKSGPEPMPIKGAPLVDIVDIPLDPSTSPRFTDPFTEFLAPKEPLPTIKDPYAQIFTSDLGFGGFSFAGTDKNTLALQENLKQSVVKQSNFN